MTQIGESSPDEPRNTDAPRAGMDETARYPLQVTNLRKEFGGIVAVDDVSFKIKQGTLTGLIGPNGAGKSTTFDCITGVSDLTAGRISFDGEEITRLRPYEIAQKGLVRTFQIAKEFEEMTVLENMMIAAKNQSGEQLWRSVLPGARQTMIDQETELYERTWAMLEFFDIEQLAHEEAGNLSGGQRKLLEMARALMTDPQMLLLDEPFAGVNPSLENRLVDHIHELRREGYTFLLVEHDIDLIMDNCERVLVMHQGSLLADGSPDEIKDDESVVEAYLGGDV